MLSAGITSNGEVSFKQELYALLDQITDKEVLELNAEYIKASDKQAFYAEFENPDGAKASTRDIFLYEKWLHYCWIRLTLSFLGYQKQQLIKRADYHKYLQDRINAAPETPLDATKKPLFVSAIPETVLFNPAVPETVADVIQRDAINQVSMEDSIEKLRRICLQIVGTEHPTDPLSQEAHDILSLIANELAKDKPDNVNLLKLLKQLQAQDPIPYIRREVHEEVSRDKAATASRFYDNLPVFTASIFDAYQLYYGAALTTHYTEIIWQALEGGLQPNGKTVSPIVLDASWAGGDAEGNDNVDPPATRIAITYSRQKAAEKHSAAIQKIISKAKSHERNLRDEIPKLHNQKFDCLIKLTNDIHIITSFQRFQTNVSMHLIHRDFAGLVELYKITKTELDETIKQVIPIPTPGQQEIITQIHLIYDEQAKLADLLHKLTLFSGSYKDSQNTLNKPATDGEQLAEGALGKFQKVFQDIIKEVGVNKNSDFIKKNNLPAMLEHLNSLLHDYQEIMQTFPEIYQTMREFRLQLQCFGMGLGFMHVRQDSSVLMGVWDVLLHAMMPDAPRFKDISTLEQIATLQKLLDESDASRDLLETIYQRWKIQDFTAFQVACRELERMELVLNNPDIFEVWIISNTASLANILALQVFKKIFPLPSQQLHIVPLLENLTDLQQSPELLEQYIRILIVEEFRQDEKLMHSVPMLQTLSNDEFKQVIKPYHQHIKHRVEVMFGYSDSERGSGLSALIEVDRKQEIFIAIAESYGMPWRIFDGAGGDLFRGGPHLARRKAKVTCQGNFRDNEYGTPTTAAIFREGQFAHSYMNLTEGRRDYKDLQPYAQNLLEQFYKTSAAYFEHFLDTEKGLGVFPGLSFGWGVKAVVELINSSSRGNTRAKNLTLKNHSDPSRDMQTGGKDNEGFVDPAPLRAIGASQLYEMLRMYMHIIIGPGFAMRNLHKDDIHKCAVTVKSLYFLCPAFQDIYEKMLYGLAAVNLDIAWDAYFLGTNLRPANDLEREKWVAEAKTYAGIYTKAYVKEKLTKAEGKVELLNALARFFVLVEDEYRKTRDFLLYTNQLIYAEIYQNNPSANNNLLQHNPELAAHMQDVWQSADPLNRLLGRISNHLAHNRKLDWVYNVSKDTKVPNSKLSIIARIIGDMADGSIYARIPVLTIALQRPVYHRRLHLQEELSTLRPDFTVLPATARSVVHDVVKQSYGFFNQNKAPAQQIDPFSTAPLVRNGLTH